MHAWAIARELGTSTLLFPAFPGVASALGLLQSEVRVDLAVGVRARPAGRGGPRPARGPPGPPDVRGGWTGARTGAGP
ncbi:hypothetical protein ACFSTC_27745 [Nonomuraea ferruginea]